MLWASELQSMSPFWIGIFVDRVTAAMQALCSLRAVCTLYISFTSTESIKLLCAILLQYIIMVVRWTDLEAHGAARWNDEGLVDLFGAHRRIFCTQEELEQPWAADLNEWNELVHLCRRLLLRGVSKKIRHSGVIVRDVGTQRNYDPLAPSLQHTHTRPQTTHVELSRFQVPSFVYTRCRRAPTRARATSTSHWGFRSTCMPSWGWWNKSVTRTTRVFHAVERFKADLDRFSSTRSIVESGQYVSNKGLICQTAKNI